MTDWNRLEAVVSNLLELYEITSAPIPLEKILQTSRVGLWESVDLSDLSIGFFAPMSLSSLYAPRMSLARMIGRMIVQSDWGRERGVPELLSDDGEMHAFARILVMPASMVDALPPANKTLEVLSEYFEVPQSDVELRLADLAQYSR